MLAASVMLFVVGYFITPWEHHDSLRNDLHIGVWSHGLDSRLVLFNDAHYDPYRGSVIGVIDSEGNLYPPIQQTEAFGDAWGIYYRYFQWSSYELWTLTVSLWYFVAISAIMPMTKSICSASGWLAPDGEEASAS